MLRLVHRFYIASADIFSMEKCSWQALPFGDVVDNSPLTGAQPEISVWSEADGNLALEICRQQFCPSREKAHRLRCSQQFSLHRRHVHSFCPKRELAHGFPTEGKNSPGLQMLAFAQLRTGREIV